MSSAQAVFLVEQDVAIRDALQTLLLAFNVPVYAYEDACHFFADITESISGCVICEAQLTDGTGLQLVKKLRESGSDIPVLLLADDLHSQFIDTADKAGAYAVIEKPLIYNKLMQSLMHIGESMWPSLSVAQRIDTVLANNKPVQIRPITKQDRAIGQVFLEYQSPWANSQEFFRDLKRLDDKILEAFADNHYPDSYALIALADRAGAAEQIGVARYVAATDHTAEFSIMVTDQWQNAGVATVLLEQLLTRAEKAGIEKLSASVKCNNQAMLALARKFSFTMSVDVADPSRVLATKNLGK